MRTAGPIRRVQPPVPGCSVPGPARGSRRQNPPWRGRQGLPPPPGDTPGGTQMAVPWLFLSHGQPTRMEVLGGTEAWITRNSSLWQYLRHVVQPGRPSGSAMHDSTTPSESGVLMNRTRVPLHSSPRANGREGPRTYPRVGSRRIREQGIASERRITFRPRHSCVTLDFQNLRHRVLRIKWEIPVWRLRCVFRLVSPSPVQQD